MIYETVTVPWKTWEMAFFMGGGGGRWGHAPDPSETRTFGAPWTFSTVRTTRKMHATPIICNWQRGIRKTTEIHGNLVDAFDKNTGSE